MRRIILTCCLCAVVLGGCGIAPASSPPITQVPRELTVFAAASLTDAFEEIGRAFEQTNPDIRVVFNFAGSQQLAAKLGQGAPADVFASANQRQIDTVIAAGRVDRATVRIFTQNSLVVVTSVSVREPILGLQDLARPGLRLVIADEAVPVGGHTLEFLRNAAADPAFGAAYRMAVLANVVSYEDNVRAVLSKVALGEGDAGIVYVSDMLADSAQVERIDIPAHLNIIAAYPVAPLADSPNRAQADAFIAYLFSDEAQRILTRYGFSTPVVATSTP